MRSYILIILLLAVAISGCQPGIVSLPSPLPPDWAYKDFRQIDPLDASNVSLDIIAAYVRDVGDKFQVRLDVFNLIGLSDVDIYVALDTYPGGSRALPGMVTELSIDWDYLIRLPATTQSQIIRKDGIPLIGARVSITGDTDQDTIEISFSKSAIPELNNISWIEIIVSQVESGIVGDRLAPFQVGGLPPPRLPVAFVFWNTFTGQTPAQALRSWDGAHTGTDSTRHGLRYLVDAVETWNVPITLIGLNTSSALSALDYMGALPRIEGLSEVGLLWILDCICCNDISIGDIGYAQFVDSNLLHQIVQHQGFSERLLSYLVENAVHRSESPLLIGGDFSSSPWGNIDQAYIGFKYMAAHPWLEPVSLSSYPGMCNKHISSPPLPSPAGAAPPSTQDLESMQAEILARLSRSSSNNISSQAQEFYRAVSAPTAAGTSTVQNFYLPQIGHILRAAEWAAQPAFTSSCANDIDWDGQTECILANEHVFATFELEGGYLAFLFTATATGVHQIIAPTYTLASGMSDPSLWDLSQGLQADPGQLLGAFVDPGQELNIYQPIIDGNELRLVSADMAMRKSFSLEAASLTITIETDAARTFDTKIPIALDPWERFTPGWGERYWQNATPKGWVWGIDYDPMIAVRANVPVQAYAFNNTRQALLLPEDPNFDYTPGHLLPFPMAVVTIFPPGIGFTISLDLDP